MAGIIAQHLLDALAASSEQDPDRASLTVRARALLVAAAARAESLGSQEEALRATLSALALEPRPELGELTELAERAARVAVKAGELSRAEVLAAGAVRDYRRLDQPVGVARTLALQAKATYHQGRVREAMTLARLGDDVAQGCSETPGAVQQDLVVTLSMCARAAGDIEEQQRLSIRLLHLAEEVQDPALMISGLNSLALTLGDLGLPTAFVALIERTVGLAREHNLLQPLGRALSNLCSETYQRDLGAAGAYAVEAVQVLRQLGEAVQLEVALTNACFTWLLAGEWDLLTSESDEWLDGRQATTYSPFLWLARALVESARGERVDAPDLIASEDAYIKQGVALCRALRLASEGETAEAARLAADTSLASFGDSSAYEDFEVLWAPTVELQLAAGDLETAERLLRLADPMLGGRSRPLTRGVVPRLRGLLAVARGEDPETDLREAEAALAAYGAPYLLARTRLELGRWLVEQGRGDEARGMLTQARETFVALRAAPSLAELDELEPVLAAVSP